MKKSEVSSGKANAEFAKLEEVWQAKVKITPTKVAADFVIVDGELNDITKQLEQLCMVHWRSMKQNSKTQKYIPCFKQGDECVKLCKHFIEKTERSQNPGGENSKDSSKSK